ncbi:MAG: ATP-dependent sacrificial sulfur transferase LarE [Bacillota bacterium]|nr:ATP-dependent sacrificial sulfur transferase LarE [Bacillota bacterium]MDW7684367.1 ATP-dependent sacrificial sulfur transferase LarE [Bacillota bacterium]
MLPENLQKKLHQLESDLQRMESLLVAFSGGVDSSVLLAVAARVLGERVLGVTAVSETYLSEELASARELADALNIQLEVIETEELAIPAFLENPPDRCYHCKHELFGKLKSVAEEKGLRFVADGSNADDTGDWRPGMKAAAELGVRSPLKEAGLTKDDIRTLARHMGLKNWDKPAMACLSSRFPYGQPITKEKVDQVAAAERYLRTLGFTQLRVRHHGDTARIELPPDRLSEAVSRAEQIVSRFKEIGFTYVSLDLAGYRSGSMNETLEPTTWGQV